MRFALAITLGYVVMRSVCYRMEQLVSYVFVMLFFLQAEDGRRALGRSRGLGDVYKRQLRLCDANAHDRGAMVRQRRLGPSFRGASSHFASFCLLYTSDAADERSSVDLGGRRIIKKKNNGRR